MKLFNLLPCCFLFLASCNGSNECSGKQVTCPSFNDAVALQWLPYKTNQQIIFNSSTAASDTFKIANVDLSASHQTTISARQPFCSAEAYISTKETGGGAQLQVSVNVQNNQYNSTREDQVYLNIKGSTFNAAGLADTGLVKASDFIVTHFYNTATVANKTFSNIQEVYQDTSRTVFKTAQVYRFWIAKNVGIVGYEEYHGNLWVKQ